MKTLLILIAATILYSSCNKNNDLRNPDPTTIDSATIMGFKDSTQLIKSITGIIYDSATGAIEDSSSRYYFYDTLNKRIILSLQPVSNPDQSYDGVEYSYNSAGLLSHVSWKYLNNTPSVGQSFITSDYIYDDANVIKSASVVLFGGPNYTISFNKTTLPSGGYQLSWTDSSPYNDNGYPGSTHYIADFDKSGRIERYSNTFGNQINWTDSIVYDLNGNFSRVINIGYFYKTSSDTNPDSTTIDTAYDFTSRDIKGDQLYNLNQIVNNGIANIPNSISYSFAGVDAIDDYVYQYSKYPVLSTNIRRTVDYNGGGIGVYHVNFSSSPEYDSKNRLVKYRMFFNDFELSYIDYIISYYK